uniref:Microfibril associated protein 5 n=1 Tax=Lates calcarifer TaxID=8187 RepID=A0A4W6D8U5_LATCA
MGSLPVVLLLCSFHVLTAGAQDQQSETPAPAATLPSNCREEMYPCTRMYSVHKPIKRCIGGLCIYSLPRVYVINKEICMRTVCEQDEYLKGEMVYLHVEHYDVRVCDLTLGRNPSVSCLFLFFFLRNTAELCRELSGWPRRFERSSNRKPCRNRRSNPKTWANNA